MEARARKTPADRGRKPARVAKKALSSDEIYERILAAITENKLPPGMQLVEERLASIFGVSRTKIREATRRLVHDRVAINLPNRGAFIATPSAEQALEVLAARRLIEPELMRMVARTATVKQIAALRTHVDREAKTRASDDPKAMIPLSGEFHLLVADMAGNSFLARTLRELETLTCLIIQLYDAPKDHSCPYDDHPLLVDALAARDEEGAAMLMLQHLDHIEASLDLSPPKDGDVKLEEVFR
jgi:DNA-binding GntR family transcriptional regulator